MHNLFNACTAFKLQRTKIQIMSLAVNVSNKPVILQQSQGHQTYNGNVDRKQDYNHAKFERSCCNGVREKSQR